eukprot:420483-Pelagomonas_calceolata.AAC.2
MPCSVLVVGEALHELCLLVHTLERSPIMSRHSANRSLFYDQFAVEILHVFVPPVLHPRSRRLLFSYEVLTPAALNFFVDYANGAVESLWSIDQYFEFVCILMLSTGLSFQ